MNFDYVEFLKDFVDNNIPYQKYLDVNDNSYFDESDYYSIKFGLAVNQLLEDNQKMRFELNGGEIKNENNK